MSKLSPFAKKSVADHNKFQDTAEINYMGGTSYTLNPLATLRLVAASSIFGERQYYKEGLNQSKTSLFNPYEEGLKSHFLNTADDFSIVVDAALHYDFKGTLELARELRQKYYMRLNPAIIYIIASIHPNRQNFTKQNPGYFKKLCKDIALRPDDITNQFEYYMFHWGKKNNLPNVVKRAWKEVLEGYDYYQMAKYQKKVKDVIRISHANNETINTLMKTGQLKMDSDKSTWERLRSEGMSWKQIFNSIKIPHMALLRNLRGIFTELQNSEEDLSIGKNVLEQLVKGVATGKQFPFRYYSAYQMIERQSDLSMQGKILDALEECIENSIKNMPKLQGRTMCLSDNSGSAWGAFNSEYGSQTVATIGNLSSLLTLANCEDGEIGLFGDKLIRKNFRRKEPILKQLQSLDKLAQDWSEGVGQQTENGIWLFFRDAIKNKEHFDNVFIYSDQQAGHGGLYGLDREEYSDYLIGSNYIDVLALVQEYRRVVNPKLNVFSVQTAGYKNSVMPQNLYRGAVLTGWTGKETVFANEIIKIWDNLN